MTYYIFLESYYYAQFRFDSFRILQDCINGPEYDNCKKCVKKFTFCTFCVVDFIFFESELIYRSCKCW